MIANLAAYKTRLVPRYTSYPTAPHFGEAIGPADYSEWLRGLDPSEPISLYLHIPFCRQLCWYCGCNMKLATRDAPIAQYAANLMDEIKLLDRHLPARMKVSHLALGGGTPTALDPDNLARIVESLTTRFDFLPGAELSIESDPRTLSKEMIRRIGALGFTRASFGVQEFDRTVQVAINRVQPPEMVRDAVERLCHAGVKGINFDLIYGLPHQTAATVERTVHLCAEMDPDRIALFGYAHVPWMAKRQRKIDEAALPGADARAEQASVAAEALIGEGFDPVGLDHFARPMDPLALAERNGTLRRNFQGYTTDTARTLIGLGATSISRTPDGYVQNTAETGAWARAVSAGILPVGKGIVLTHDDRLRGNVIEQLMCNGTVDLAEAARRFEAPINWAGSAGPALADLVRDGVITSSGMRIALTEEGRPLVRVVAAAFDAYLGNRHARHSVAV
ncbi:MAG: oxygen-independent coproporphyrinogen III oxidase [Pseudomonadota bacterium]